MLSGFFGGLALPARGNRSLRDDVAGEPQAHRDRHPHGARRPLVAGRRADVPQNRLADRIRSVAGAALSYWASQHTATLLYDMDARDPLTFIGAALFLCAVSAIAAWLPARRAARIDPARVLREA